LIIGVDVGGANTKICDDQGRFIKMIYNPLWKEKSLEKPLSEIPEGSELAVVMTGELSDVFSRKLDGIEWIVSEVKKRFSSARFFGLDMKFHEFPSLLLDASNWLASASFISLDFPDVIFADMGSTTTDLIPIVGGEVKAHLRDPDRVLMGELLYFGALRTPVSSILPVFDLEGRKIRVASEYFASLADVYLILGDISEEDYLCETPDGRGKTREKALRRMARMFCADLEEVSEDLLIDFCMKLKEAQLKELEEALKGISSSYGLSSVFGCGIGEFLLREASERADLEFISASELYGKEVSEVFPAFSVANLMKREKESSQLM